MTTFFRVLREGDKGEALLEEVRAARRGEVSRRRFEVDPRSFGSVPRSPFAYWVSERMRALFKELPPFEGEGRTAKQGLATADDFRFVRTWWEVRAERILDSGRRAVGSGQWSEERTRAFQEWCRRRTHEGKRWVPFAKGGTYSPFYADVHLAVNWERDGREIATFDRAFIRNPEFFFRPGLTWPLRTTSGLSMRALPAGCVFGHKGPAAFIEDDPTVGLLALLATTNSSAFRECVGLQLAAADAAARSYEVGVIQSTPVPHLDLPTRDELARLARRAWSLTRCLDTASEHSHAFTLPALIQVEGEGLNGRATAWSEHLSAVEGELVAIQAEIDERCFKLYGIDEADRRAIGEASGGGEASAEADSDGSEGDDAEEEDADEAAEAADAPGLVAELISWAVGVAFGRFDVRLATGHRPLPTESDPFDPLPVCSPGMFQGDDGLPAKVAPPGYPLPIDEDGILVDEPGHSDDLLAHVREIFRVVFGDRGDAMEQEACGMLGVRDLRAYLARTGNGGFWVDHVRRYSKSRRVAPIYWLLQSPRGTTRVWVYLHRLDRDTLPKVLSRRYLGGIAERVRHDIAELRARLEAGERLTKAEEKRLAALDERAADLEEFMAWIKRVLERTNDRGEVAGYAPNLDDGVVLAAAPLYELIPWPRKVTRGNRRVSALEGYWIALSEGAYNWSAVAMHYWPTMAETACRTDKSVAIAHNRLDLYEGAQ